jgi:hypothetical protein
MLYISDNLKYLRNKRSMSQQEASDGMKLGLDQYKNTSTERIRRRLNPYW